MPCTRRRMPCTRRRMPCMRRRMPCTRRRHRVNAWPSVASDGFWWWWPFAFLRQVSVKAWGGRFV